MLNEVRTFRFTRQSPFTGDVNSMDVEMTIDQHDRLEIGEELIQNILPYHSPDVREFIMTGITPEEWGASFGEDK